MRIIIFFFFLFSFSFSQEEKRLALVIGNSEYTKGPLKNPVNDATLIAETLEKLDFEVILHKNLIQLSEAKDDYLFRINVDQTLKQFISDFPYEKYRKVYDTQQLEEKISKLEQITNQT